MPYFVYILQSQKDQSFYIGQTQNLTERIQRHNQGRNSSTRTKRPWKLVYFEEYTTRQEAMKREREIKRRKSSKYILSLIRQAAFERGKTDSQNKRVIG